MRFLLAAGGEFHVRTDGTFRLVYEALRYDAQGRGMLLYK